ncbi:S-adenosyl-L-methionine-dependent methyltransferase [Lentithecium fluviatile CBS 122367]|uniref:S-adenosyl-L-methionine-dependent methyltransferase n=1 Tax=Lentithecium fluviatile CBS 122367 TaxID=1168545 RepID=A0A6G1IIC1_9PLEO|nr:S-adenosyl-L-methionine-dependent methyltransferase [Lentithecium fluviatile CBS 122367]
MRRKTIDTLQYLQYMLEPSEETMLGNCTLSSIRVSLDKGIFNILSESNTPLSLSELAARTSADPVLLGRFPRHQASLGCIEETEKNEFTASNLTRNLSIPAVQAGFYFFKNVLDPAFQAIPEYLAARKYQNPNSLLDAPFNAACTEKCFSFLPIDKESADWPRDKPVFVDQRFPQLPGKVILQDLPAVVEEAKVDGDVEVMGYDFFTLQPMKGAKYYYLRAVLQDHTDEKCLEILKQIADAMTEKSTLLIDDIVVPNKNVLLAKGGLTMQKITTYTHSF